MVRSAGTTCKDILMETNIVNSSLVTSQFRSTDPFSLLQTRRNLPNETTSFVASNTMVTTGKGMYLSKSHRIRYAIYEAILEILAGFVASINRTIDISRSTTLNPLGIP